MLSNNKRNLCFFLGFLTHYAVVLIHCLPYWRVSNWQVSSALQGRLPQFDGVWWHCMSIKTGGFTCDNYGKPSIFAKTDIQAARALMIISTIFSFVGLLLSLLSLDCTTFLVAKSKTKNTTALIGGLCYIVTGLSCGVAVSWFAFRITYEYYSPLYNESEFTYEFGPCLYMGWVATLFSFVGGSILTVGSCRNINKKKIDKYAPNRAYMYNPSSSALMELNGTKTEYV